MKLNEIIELNGKEYTVELNRESALRIEQYTDQQGVAELISKPIYEDKSKDEIKEGENPFDGAIEEEEILSLAQEKEKAIKDVICRAFWIWLYPKEKIEFKEIEKIFEPIFNDDKQANYVSNLYTKLMEKSVKVRQEYLEEQKNLKAPTK